MEPGKIEFMPTQKVIKEMKTKRCNLFSHVWSRDVYIDYGSDAMTVKVCLKCQRVRKSRFYIMNIRDLNSFKIIDAIQDAMKLEGIPYQRDNSIGEK